MAGHPALPSLSAGTLKHRSEGHPSEVPPPSQTGKGSGEWWGESSGRVQRGLDGTSAGAVAAGVQVGAGAEGGDSAFPGRTAGQPGWPPGSAPRGHQGLTPERHALFGSGALPKPLARPRLRAPRDHPWRARPQGTGYPVDPPPALQTAPPQGKACPHSVVAQARACPPPRQVLRGPQSRGLVLPEPDADQRAPLGG